MNTFEFYYILKVERPTEERRRPLLHQQQRVFPEVQKRGFPPANSFRKHLNVKKLAPFFTEIWQRNTQTSLV